MNDSKDPHDPTQILSRVQTTDRYATYLLKEDGNILLAGLCLLGCLPVGVGGGLAVVVHAVHLCCFGGKMDGNAMHECTSGMKKILRSMMRMG